MIERDPAFVDYETFWDVKYSLRQQSMSTTDYVHDARFEKHGASVALGTDSPMWVREDELHRWLENRQAEGCMLVAHHMLFDGYVTTHTEKLEYEDYFCTMGMIEALYQGAVGRGLDEAMKSLLGYKHGKTDILARTKGKHWHEFTDEEKASMIKYANFDTLAMQQLFYKFSGQLPQDEWRIMSLILQMFCRPVLEFDSKLLKEALVNAQDDRDSRILSACDHFKITEDDLRKNGPFTKLIESCGIRMPMKPSPKVAGKMIPALAKDDQGFIDLLEHDNPQVQALAEGRLAVKSTQAITRAQRFVDLDNAIGKLPAAYNYYRAHTGRLTGANKINVANLKRGSDLRKSIVAPEGHVLVVVDSGQIECRDVGYLAGEDSQTELFRRKEDPYNDMAAEIFGRPVDRKNNPDDELPGFIGKTARLGLGFQMGGPKFQWTANTKAKTELDIDLNFSLDEAYRVVSVYRNKHPHIKEFWYLIQNHWLPAMVNNEAPFSYEYGDGDGKLEIDTKGNKIWFPNGTYLFYPCLQYEEGQFHYVTKLGSKYVYKKIYGGLCTENIVQKHTRDIVAWQMLRISERYRVAMHTYDENVAVVPEDEAEEALAWMLDIMTTPPPWAASLPLGAEGGYAREYSK